MSETMLTIEDAARRLPDVVDHVYASGESAVLLRSGTPVARIVRVPNETKRTENLIAFLRKWRVEHPEPDEQFAQAIEESRKSMSSPHDPWE
jgi:antitoxin (DNA-binding transcriptional repressor) of toxin-antitoxin stability system